jgi:hypothetical protein
MNYPGEGPCRLVAHRIIGQLWRGEVTPEAVRLELQGIEQQDAARAVEIRRWLRHWGAHRLKNERRGR